MLKNKNVDVVINKPFGEDVVHHMAYATHGAEMFVQIGGKWYLIFETPEFDSGYYTYEDEEVG